MQGAIGRTRQFGLNGPRWKSLHPDGWQIFTPERGVSEAWEQAPQDELQEGAVAGLDHSALVHPWELLGKYNQCLSAESMAGEMVFNTVCRPMR